MRETKETVPLAKHPAVDSQLGNWDLIQTRTCILFAGKEDAGVEPFSKHDIGVKQMQIDSHKCNRCMACVPYCPVQAILVKEDAVVIDGDRCLECGVCLRAGCPVKAIRETPEAGTWPRSVTRAFSDPTVYHRTRIPGRGTEEIKTNDVTGNVKRGEVGVIIEVGRPYLGADFTDIEKITRRLSAIGVKYEPNNPLVDLMEDQAKGIFFNHLKKTRLISAIIQFTIPVARLGLTLRELLQVSGDIETVFSLSLMTRFCDGGGLPGDLERVLADLGLTYRHNAKVNLGLGKPLKDD
jgi:Pyruvate/2-oxoacid:ferredoxin oxidoreductase delta subunit